MNLLTRPVVGQVGARSEPGHSKMHTHQQGENKKKEGKHHCNPITAAVDAPKLIRTSADTHYQALIHTMAAPNAAGTGGERIKSVSMFVNALKNKKIKSKTGSALINARCLN